jgi:hypothetical protein
MSYAAFIDRFPDHSFDLVIIDGRARAACIQHAIPKVKKGGYLLVDDSERYDLSKIRYQKRTDLSGHVPYYPTPTLGETSIFAL